MKKIILGSASPRRRELMEQLGAKFEVRVSEKEEVYHSTEPEEIVKELALMKAENVAADLKEDRGEDIKDTVILGADTVVVLDGEILGKPKDEEDAFRMLGNLRGRGHMVYTGVAMLDYDEEGNRRVKRKTVETKVFVHGMSNREIREYIATGEPVDKAGAYGIQGQFARFIDRIEGDYYNVVGLPVSCVYRLLKETEL